MFHLESLRISNKNLCHFVAMQSNAIPHLDDKNYFDTTFKGIYTRHSCTTFGSVGPY